MSQELMPRQETQSPIQIIQHQPRVGEGEGGDFVSQLSEYAQGGNEVTMTLKMRSRNALTAWEILVRTTAVVLGGVILGAFVFFLMTAGQ